MVAEIRPIVHDSVDYVVHVLQSESCAHLFCFWCKTMWLLKLSELCYLCRLDVLAFACLSLKLSPHCPSRWGVTWRITTLNKVRCWPAVGRCFTPFHHVTSCQLVWNGLKSHTCCFACTNTALGLFWNQWLAIWSIYTCTILWLIDSFST